ncbi:protein kinase [bacterium]|nr:protein kinase [bacterium]
MDGVSTSLNSDKPDPLVGKVIDKYVILDRLGKGGMGLVYKAQHQRIKRYAALKLLPARESRDEVSVKRLEREATAMGKLQHPAIATMYDFGMTDEGQPYIVMELMRGENLKQYLKQKGRLEAEEALAIFLQISEAMAYAHGMGLMHRDLKPENIMFAEDLKELEQTDTLVTPARKSAIKVLDFGIARHTEESLMLTRTGQIVGSASYMSPEQCSGKKPVDTRTDIYSLGVIMYEMLTGSLPYKGETFLETIYLKTTELPAPFPENLENPPGLENLVLKCLMVQPEDRPQSMEEVNAALRTIADASNPSGSQNSHSNSNATVAITKIEKAEKPGTTTDTNAAATEVPRTQSNLSKKKILLAAALVGAVSILTAAVLTLSSSNSKQHSQPEPGAQTTSRTQDKPLKQESKNSKNSKNHLSGTASGADALMGKPAPARPLEPEKAAAKSAAKSARSARTKTKATKIIQTSTPPPSPQQISPAPARTSLPPVAPPYQAPPSNSSPGTAPAPSPTGTRGDSISKDPSYYQRQYQKYKKTGKRIDKKIRQLLRKF